MKLLPVSLQYLLLLIFVIYLCLQKYFNEESYSFFFFLLPIYAKTSISGILNVTRYRMTKIKIKTILGK